MNHGLIQLMGLRLTSGPEASWLADMPFGQTADQRLLIHLTAPGNTSIWEHAAQAKDTNDGLAPPHRDQSDLESER